MASKRWVGTLPYFRAPEVPWCIIGKESWGVAIACKVPEANAAYYCQRHGFTVLIRDTDFPVPLDDLGTAPDVIPSQRNPQRPKHGYGYSETDDGA